MIEPPEIPPSVRTDWKSAASDFFSAKLALFGLEAQDFARIASRKVALLAVAAFGIAVMWLCLIAGLIGWIPALTNGRVAWYFVAIGLAVIHLIVAGIAIRMAARPVPEVFPLTKQEFEKDQKWLKSLIQKKLD